MAQTHFMVDLETFGTRSDAAFVTVAAVEFDPKDKNLFDKIEKGDFRDMRSFVANVDPDQRATCDKSTIMWWLQQGPEARKSLSGNTLSERKALEALCRFMAGEDPTDALSLNLGSTFIPVKDRIVWSRGNSFDFPILSNGFNRQGMVAPWAFWNTRDARTVAKMSPKRVPSRDRLKWFHAHDALHDCYAQIWEILFAIKSGRLYV